MLHIPSNMENGETYPFNAERVDLDEITQDNSYELVTISSGITRVTTNAENKAARVVRFADTENEAPDISSEVIDIFNDSTDVASKTDVANKAGLLKLLIIGSTILAGVGALAAAAGGIYCFYMAGRQSVGGCPENIRLPHSSEPPARIDKFLRQVDGTLLTIPGYDSRAGVNSTLTPEISSFPYSYYESIYGKTVVTITEEPDITTTRRSTSVSMAIESTFVPRISGEEIKWYDHAKERSIHYRALVGDYEDPHPLGPVFEDRISSFCHSEKVKNIINQAYLSDVEERCALLARMVNTILKFKYKLAALIQNHNQQETLLRYDYAQEVMMRRKLTTLLMAAEFIMEKRNFDEFYYSAMLDYRQYSISEMDIREKAILKNKIGC